MGDQGDLLAKQMEFVEFGKIWDVLSFLGEKGLFENPGACRGFMFS